MKKSEFFTGGKNLKAADLPEPKGVTIEIVKRQPFAENGSEVTKPVVYFKKCKKALVLNGVNWDSIADIAGSGDSDDWAQYQSRVVPNHDGNEGEGGALHPRPQAGAG
jgi:hypothetical protein